MTLCNCGGDTNLIIDDYIIQTRIPGRKNIILTNIRFHQCKICGQMEPTDDSRKMIQVLRNHYTDSYFREAAKQEELEANSGVKPSLTKGFLKQLFLS